MLEQISKHGGMDLLIKADGDLDVDLHHTNRRCRICLGECLSERWEAKEELKGMDSYCRWTIRLHRWL